MSKDPAKLEKALAKQARRDVRKAKDNARKNQILSVQDPSRINISNASLWTLHGCWIGEDWADTKSLSQLAVARKNSAGVVAAATFIVDLGCLGIKDAHSQGFVSDTEFDMQVLVHMGQHQEMQPCSLDFAAKVIQTAIAYAKGLGFEPHKDAHKAMRLLGEAQPENCLDEIPTGGEDGRPLYINGPYDNINKVINTLNKSVGEGNYGFIKLGAGGFFDDMEFMNDIDFDNLEFTRADDFDDDDFDDDTEKVIDVVAKNQST